MFAHLQLVVVAVDAAEAEGVEGLTRSCEVLERQPWWCGVQLAVSHQVAECRRTPSVVRGTPAGHQGEVVPQLPTLQPLTQHLLEFGQCSTDRHEVLATVDRLHRQPYVRRILITTELYFDNDK